MRSGHRPRAVPVRWCWAGSAGTPGQSPGSRALATRSARGATHQPPASSPRRQSLDRWFQLMDVTSRSSAVLRMRRIPSVGRSASANSDDFDLQIALSAGSSDLLFKRLKLLRAEVITDPDCDLMGRQQAIWLHDRSLAVDPLRLDRVEPGALDGQATRHDPDTAFRLDPAIVCLDPGADPLADVPTRVVPDQQQRRLAFGRQAVTDPTQEVLRHLADRPALDKPQQHPVGVGPE